MPFYTPLRYPGGKRRLATSVKRLLEVNLFNNVEYVEPYAGGAAVALDLLFEEYASTIHINDLSRPVYAFWHAVLNNNTDLCRQIQRVKVTMAEWKRQRSVYEQGEKADLDRLGFATLFLNRTNRSGIIGGGVIGGQQQTGNWALDARFNRDELVNRIRKIGRYKSRIRVYQMDALAFINYVVPQLDTRRVFSFYDPPYIEAGETLYLNNYTIDDHRHLAMKVVALEQPWIVTYDYAALSANLYPGHRRMIYDLPYSAQSRYRGREVMFLSPRLRLPSDWRSSRRVALGHPNSRHPFYGKMESMKAHSEMDEGPHAFERFRKAVKSVLSVPKNALPPKPSRKKKKQSGRKT